MIKLIYGAKGTGKTKKIIDLANETVTKAKGDLVFINDTSKYMYELVREIRFINAKEDYEIKTEFGLLGFIRGITAMNTDVEYIFIDGITRLIPKTVDELEMFMLILENYSEKLNIKFVLTISCDADKMPKFFDKYEKLN